MCTSNIKNTNAKNLGWTLGKKFYFFNFKFDEAKFLHNCFWHNLIVHNLILVTIEKLLILDIAAFSQAYQSG